MPETTSAAEQAAVPYHWVMTVQTADGRLNTRDAVVEVPQGFTRKQLFHFVLGQFQEEYGTPLIVLFFDLQLSQL